MLASAEKVDNMARQRTSQSLWAESVLPVGDDVAESIGAQVAIFGVSFVDCRRSRWKPFYLELLGAHLCWVH